MSRRVAAEQVNKHCMHTREPERLFVLSVTLRSLWALTKCLFVRVWVCTLFQPDSVREMRRISSQQHQCASRKFV